MNSCKCSIRALEIFLKDFSNLSIRRPLNQSRVTPFHRSRLIHLQSRRYYGAVAARNAIEREGNANANGNGSGNGEEWDGSVPFDFEVKGRHSDGVLQGTATTDLRREEAGIEKSEDWHAEIHIVAPGSRGITKEDVAESVALHDEQGGELDAVANELMSDLSVESQDARPIDETSFQGLHGQGHAEGLAEQMPSLPAESALEHAATASRAESTSRVKNRLQRKLRRVEAGTYRQDAEKRNKEQEDEAQLSTVLENIEAMDGPDVGVAGEQRARPVLQKGSGLESRVAAKKIFARADGKPRDNATEINPSNPRSNFKKEDWQIQKKALKAKFGEENWQPRKRLSPDTLDGIRALRASDPGSYTTQTLSEHFKITPEAIRRILKSKWRPNADEIEQRRVRWEKRGERKWTEMAEQGTRPPAKWRAKGIRAPWDERKREEQRKQVVRKKDDRQREKDDGYLKWDSEASRGKRLPSLSGRIL